MDLTGLLATIAMTCAGLAFTGGLLITAVTGRVKPVKRLLLIVASLVVAALAVGLVFSRGLLVYLLFQIIAFILVLFLVVIAGAVCGGGIYLLLHCKPAGTLLNPDDLSAYLPLPEFVLQAGITEERGLSRIRSGFYQGGLCEGRWYVHRSELGK